MPHHGLLKHLSHTCNGLTGTELLLLGWAYSCCHVQRQLNLLLCSHCYSCFYVPSNLITWQSIIDIMFGVLFFFFSVRGHAFWIYLFLDHTFHSKEERAAHKLLEQNKTCQGIRYHCEAFRTFLMYQTFTPRHTAKLCANGIMTQNHTTWTTIFRGLWFFFLSIRDRKSL